MLRYRHDDWLWNEQPIELNPPEAMLVMLLLLSQNSHHSPHVLLAHASNRPVSPAAARTHLAGLRRWISWLGKSVDRTSRAKALAVAQDPETLAVLELEPAPTTRATAVA